MIYAADTSNHKVRAFIAEIGHSMGLVNETDRRAALFYAPEVEGESLRGAIRHCASLVTGLGPNTGGLDQQLSRALTTSDFTAILAGIINKRLAAAYSYAPGTFTEWMADNSCSNFKPISLARLLPPPELPEIIEEGEFKHLKVVDGEESAALRTFGGILAISRYAMINDDLHAIQDRGRILGMTTRLSQNKHAYKELLANNTLSDGVEVFHASRGNYLTGAATNLSRDSLALALKTMRMMTDPVGNILGIEPKILLVPPSLEITAHELCFSDSMPGQSNAAVPNIFKKIGLRPVVEPLLESPSLDGSSAKAWYLFPDKTMWPVYTALALGTAGNYAPYIENSVVWNSDAIETKVRTDFEAAAIGWTAIKVKGEA